MDSNQNADKAQMDEAADPTEQCLLLIQQLYNQGSINDDQRDNLKGKLIKEMNRVENDTS